MPSTQNKTFALQTDLGWYCRTGINQPITSIEAHTFQYRRLVYNAIKDTLKTAYPITRKLIGKKRWKKAVAHFFENHKCETPQIWRLPLEFCDYYTENKLPFKKDFPCIQELLRYEWLEIEVFMMEDLPVEKFKSITTSQNEVVVHNPEIKILPLQYPIHTKKIKQITEADKGQYFVTIHRDYYTKQVKFHDLSYPFVELLVTLNEEETTINDLKTIFSKYETDSTSIASAVDDFIAFAFQNNLILGCKP